MGRVLIKLYDENNNEIFFGRDLHTAKFISIIFQGYSCIVIRNFLNIIKSRYMCEKTSMAKISEILDAFGYECLGLDHLDGYSEFKKISFEIVGAVATQDDAYQYKIHLNIIISDWQKYCFNDCLRNLDVSSMYPTSGLYWSNARGGRKSMQLKSLNELSFSFNKEGGENMTRTLPNPKRVICSGPVTTVIYEDGSKTHVRKTEDDQNDYEKAFLLSWLYKTYGKKVVEKKLEEFQEEFKAEEPTKNDDIVISAKAVAKRMNDFLKVSSKKYLG